MLTRVLLPQFGMAMESGTVRHWHKGVGDRVERDEPLVEIESAKAVNDVSAPISGVLVEILVGPDQDASVGDVLGTIEHLDGPA